MAIVSDVEIRLRADIARLQQDMNAMRRTVDQGMGAITKAADLAKKALGAIGGAFAIKELVGQVVGAQREFDKLNASLVTATGSSANAAQAFGALQRFAATTPYSVAEATEAFIKLRNLGLSPSEKALTSYGNTAAAMGKGLNQLIEAVADAATGEFERLKEFGVKAKQNGDQVALTFQGTTKMVGNNAKDIQKYLQDIGNVNFAGAMEKRLNTLDGAISNLGDSWESTLRAISSGGFGEGVQSAVMALSNALSDLGDIFTAVGGAASTEGGKVQEAAGLHAALTGAFKLLAIAGVGLVAAFREISSELSALNEIGKAKDLAGIKAALAARNVEAKQIDDWLKGKIAAIQGAVQAGNAARDAETANVKKNGGDQLAQYEVVLNAEQQRDKALQDSLEVRNKLNGVNAQTAGDLKKLKAAYDTGAISLADYNHYVAQTNKETTLASTAYKNGVKAIDLSTEAIKQRAAAQAWANQQAAEQLDFLKRTGQVGEADFITQSAAADIKALKDSQAALREQSALEAKKIDSKQKVLELNAQVEQQERQIDARRLKAGQDQFELDQKLYREAAGNTADLIEAAQAESKSQKDKTRDMQDEIDMLGLTEKQIAEITAVRLREAAAVKLQRAEVLDLIDATGQLGAEARKQAEEMLKQADLGLTKQRVQEQQKFWGDIEQTAHDTFLSIGNGGDSLWTRLKNSAKNIFFEWLYQMTLKKWIINIGTSSSGSSSVAGLLGSGSSSSGLSSLSSMSNLFETGSNLYKAVSGGFASISTGVADAVQAGLYQSGLSTSIASNGAFASGAGAFASVGAGVLGGIYGGRALSGGYGSNGAVNTGTAIGAAVGSIVPVIGTALGALVGGLFGGAYNRAFGYKAKEYSDTSTLSGMLGAGTFSGTLDTAYTQKGGWFRSDKNGVDKAAVDATQASGLTAAYDAIKAATTDYAKVLGLNADSIATRTQTVSIALGKDEAANEKAIADFFTGVGDSIAKELLPDISQFQVAGESAGATLQRLATDFKTVDLLMTAVGVDAAKAFGVSGTAAIAARERIIALAGGLDALGSQLDFYYSNFLGAAEKIAPLQKQINDQLGALGVPWIKTASDYRLAVEHLVNSGQAATESGAELYAGLLKLAPAFKGMVDAVNQLNQAAIDRGFAALARAVDAQKDIVTEAYNDAMKVLDAQVENLNSTISKTTELSEALKGAMQGIDTPQAGEYSRRAAQAQITAFLAIARAGGALPAASDIRDALSALGNDPSGSYSTLADYQRDVARTNNELEQLGGLSDTQLSVAQQQLELLQAQKDQATLAYDAEIARLDGLAAVAQRQLDAINGVDTSVKSVAAALAEVNYAIATFAAGIGYGLPASTTTAPTSGPLSMIKQMLFGEVPTDNSVVSSGTMSSSSADMETVMARLVAMEESAAATARATERLADQFNAVSGGGQYLLVDQA